MNEVDVKLFVLNSKSTSRTSIDYLERLIGENNNTGAALILNEEKLSRINYYYSVMVMEAMVMEAMVMAKAMAMDQIMELVARILRVRRDNC